MDHKYFSFCKKKKVNSSQQSKTAKKKSEFGLMQVSVEKNCCLPQLQVRCQKKLHVKKKFSFSCLCGVCKMKLQRISCVYTESVYLHQSKTTFDSKINLCSTSANVLILPGQTRLIEPLMIEITFLYRPFRGPLCSHEDYLMKYKVT